MSGKHLDISHVVAGGLCHGCGVCAGTCSTTAIRLDRDRDRGLYVPRIDPDRCIRCGICDIVCPGAEVPFNRLGRTFLADVDDDVGLGRVLDCDLGHAASERLRHDCTSGGVTTALLMHALETGVIDGVLTTRMNAQKPLEPEVFVARTAGEIIGAAGSKYCPVPVGGGLRDIAGGQDRVAVVGLACHIHGIRLAQMALPALRDRIVFCVGIFCGHTDSFLATEYALKRRGIPSGQVASLSYRGHGWPGSMQVNLVDGSARTWPYREHIAYHEQYFFTPHRCLTCTDGINRLSDIVVMDAWLPEFERPGENGLSFVLTRSEAGRRIWTEAAQVGAVVRRPRDREDIWRSHGSMRLSNSDFRAHAAIARLLGQGVPRYDLPPVCSYPVNWLRAILMWGNAWLTARAGRVRVFTPLIEWQIALARNLRRC